MDLNPIVNSIRTARDAAREEADRLDKAFRAVASLAGRVGRPSLNGSVRTLSAKGRAAISKAQRERWAKIRAAKTGKKTKKHWTQTPKGRAFMRTTASKRFGTAKAK